MTIYVLVLLITLPGLPNVYMSEVIETFDTEAACVAKMVKYKPPEIAACIGVE